MLCTSLNRDPTEYLSFYWKKTNPASLPPTLSSPASLSLRVSTGGQGATQPVAPPTLCFSECGPTCCLQTRTSGLFVRATSNSRKKILHRWTDPSDAVKTHTQSASVFELRQSESTRRLFSLRLFAPPEHGAQTLFPGPPPSGRAELPRPGLILSRLLEPPAPAPNPPPAPHCPPPSP